jgi:hypothetical protein
VSAIQILEYASWHEFKRDFLIELFGKSGFRRGRYLFRGMGNADWSLSSSFDRRFSTLSRDQRLQLWDELINEWRRECEETGIPDAVVHDDQKLWALGQHNGLPTRLLDWTTSPYIAAFFAFQGWVLQLPEEFSHVAIWALHQDNPVWSKEMGVEIVTAPALENIRLRNQSGQFTLSRTPFASLEEYVEQFATDPALSKAALPASEATPAALTKAVLPASEAVPALPDLDSMGINNYQLFPDFTGLAGRATMRLLLELAARDW